MTIKINHALVIDGYCICSPSLISFKTDGSLGLGFSSVLSERWDID